MVADSSGNKAPTYGLHDSALHPCSIKEEK